MRPVLKRLCYTLAAISLTPLTGCQTNQPLPGATDAQSNLHAGQSVGDTESYSSRALLSGPIENQLHTALTYDDNDALVDLFDSDALAKEAIAIADEPEVAQRQQEFQSNFRERFKDSLIVVSDLMKKESWQYLSSSDSARGTRTHHFIAQKAINDSYYFVSFTSKRIGGKEKIIDWRNESSGISIIESIVLDIKGLLGVFAYFSNSGLARPAPAYEYEVSKFFVAAFRDKDGQKTFDAYQYLPEDMQSNMHVVKTVLYRRESDTIIPNDSVIWRYAMKDPTTVVASLFEYLHNEDWRLANMAVSKTMETFGENSLLLRIQANALAKLGHKGDAFTVIRKAIQAFPDDPSNYSVLLDIFIQNKQYDDAVLVLKAIEERFYISLRPDKLRDEYKQFASSSAFNLWASTKN